MTLEEKKKKRKKKKNELEKRAELHRRHNKGNTIGKGWWVNFCCGDVEKAIGFWNHVNGADKATEGTPDIGEIGGEIAGGETGGDAGGTVSGGDAGGASMGVGEALELLDKDEEENRAERHSWHADDC